MDDGDTVIVKQYGISKLKSKIVDKAHLSKQKLIEKEVTSYLSSFHSVVHYILFDKCTSASC